MDKGTEDKELLQKFRVAETKELAFKTIIQKYQERIYWIIRHLVINHDFANEVLQNVFITAWKELMDFEENRKLFSWLCRIAVTEYYGFTEKKETISILRNEIATEKNFNAARLQWKLILAVHKLSKEDQVIFTLRYFEEMSYEEIAEVLDINENILKATYYHAVKRIEADTFNNH